MNEDTKSKVLKIKKLQNDFYAFLSTAIKNRNKKIQEILKREDDKRIKDILNNLK